MTTTALLQVLMVLGAGACFVALERKRRAEIRVKVRKDERLRRRL